MYLDCMYLKKVDDGNINKLPFRNNSVHELVDLKLQLYMTVLLHMLNAPA